MLLRLVYLAVTNMFSLRRLMSMGGGEKEIEILVLRHQLTVMRRQVAKPAFTPAVRFGSAAVLPVRGCWLWHGMRRQ